MRILIALAVFVALVVAGVIGFVVVNETSRGEAPVSSSVGSLASAAKIATISNGERVDIAAHIPRDGHTVVMFTADF